MARPGENDSKRNDTACAALEAALGMVQIAAKGIRDLLFSSLHEKELCIQFWIGPSPSGAERGKQQCHGTERFDKATSKSLHVPSRFSLKGPQVLKLERALC